MKQIRTTTAKAIAFGKSLTMGMLATLLLFTPIVQAQWSTSPLPNRAVLFGPAHTNYLADRQEIMADYRERIRIAEGRVRALRIVIARFKKNRVDYSIRRGDIAYRVHLSWLEEELRNAQQAVRDLYREVGQALRDLHAEYQRAIGL